MPNEKIAPAWKFFTIAHPDEKYARCNICPPGENAHDNGLSRGKDISSYGTSTLNHHLQTKHPKEWEAELKRSKEESAK